MGEIMVSFIVLAVLAVTAATLPISLGLSHKMKDASSAMQIKTAVINYQTEYGELPIPAGAVVTKDDLIIGPAPGSDPGNVPTRDMIHFYQGLCGNINSYAPADPVSSKATGFNDKNIAYLNLQKGQVDANGVMVQVDKANGVNGHSSAPSPNNFIYFSIKEDTNYDGIISGLPDPNYATDGGTPFGAKTSDSCAVWCNNDQPYDKVTPRWSTTH